MRLPWASILALAIVSSAQLGYPQDKVASRPPAAPPVERLIYGNPSHGYPLADTSGVRTGIVDKRGVLTRKLADGEALWGFGERFDSLNMRGRTMETWIADAWGGGNRSYICTPFLISSAGYGLFVNCTGKVKFDCGATKRDELRIEVPESGLDVFVFHGTPRETLVAYTKLVGRPQPVPDWVFEPWISRNSYLSAYEVDRVIDKMEACGLKASAVVLEGWAEGLQSFRFEQRRYPNTKQWIEKLHECGYHVVCWETPSLWDSASTYLDAKTNGFLVLKPDGSELRIDWLENAVKIDFRKLAARAWWQRLHEPLINMGVDGFKTDGGERMPDEWFHNLHPYYYQRAVLDAFRAGGKVGMTFARSGTAPCAGNATFWGGDQSSSWNDFPRVVRAGLSAALSGFPYWGHDIGGYSGTPTKNLYIRWLELGAFSPIMQLHGTTPREPWYYDDETVRIAKYYFDLRWRLRDYLLAAAKSAREDGVPMWRPLLYEYPDDPATYNIDDEFFLGGGLLVAPILTESGERTVYLPRGEWVNVWTREPVTGPNVFTVRPKLAEIPVFVRAEQAAKFERMFPPLPSDPRSNISLELAGATNERGIVPTRRFIRGQKYEKIFVTVRNRKTNETDDEVSLNLPNGFTALPGATQRFHASPQGEARLAFYVSWPGDLAVGSYPIRVGAASLQPLQAVLVKSPTHWQVIGPFDGGVGREFTGELPTDSAAEYLGTGGRKVRWKDVGDDCVRDDGYIDFEKALGKGNTGATTFGRAIFKSEGDRPAKLYLGSGDGLTVWLNGQQVFDKQVHRSAEPDEDAVDVNPRAGENSVLVKISRGIGPNGLYFRVAAGS
ncbi:MAG: TIM-barrel domain-containing protein [Verrucomicrobiia bacterium]